MKVQGTPYCITVAPESGPSLGVDSAADNGANWVRHMTRLALRRPEDEVNYDIATRCARAQRMGLVCVAPLPPGLDPASPADRAAKAVFRSEVQYVGSRALP